MEPIIKDIYCDISGERVEAVDIHAYVCLRNELGRVKEMVTWKETPPNAEAKKRGVQVTGARSAMS